MTATDDLVLRPQDVLPSPLELPHADVDIAVVAQLNLPGQTEETYRLLRRFTRLTLEELRDAGARPALVDVSADEEPDYEIVRRAHGIIVLGGGDVDPSFYGVHEPIPHEFGRDPRSDERQLRMIHAAIEDDAALLAVCRGSQLLNVACGGTLVRDLQPGTLHHGTEGAPMFLDEQVELAQDTRLHQAYGRDRLTVRSGHHQAVDRVGEGLRVAARALDGVVEATERVDNTWVVGVQWHPEDGDGAGDDRLLLFNAFLDQARARSRSRV
ncbi:MAG: hypothetical protein MOP51_2486 [Citricoccus sp.]|nr:hypothetical protein [Citricoccus sp. WCRC_4]